ncbi:hypothetical protein EFM26_05300 [Limosilactobacillus fermentum]|nr:hypothetical protein [Limosilactobacillus fermentum]
MRFCDYLGMLFRLKANHGPFYPGAGHLYTIEVDQIKKSYLYQIAQMHDLMKMIFTTVLPQFLFKTMFTDFQ